MKFLGHLFVISAYAFAGTLFASEANLRIQFLLSEARPQYAGPNCWNSVLYTKGISPGVFYSDEEIKLWLNSPLCRVVNRPVAGDIVDIARVTQAAQEYASLHSYTYLSPSHGFTKNGPDPTEPYQITDHGSIRGFYDLTERDCLNRTHAEGISAGCWIVETYHRCQSIDSLMPGFRSRPEYIELTSLGERLTRMVFSSADGHGDFVRLRQLGSKARAALAVPSYSDLSSPLQRLVDKISADSTSYGRPGNEDRVTEISYLRAHPSQRAVDAGSDLVEKLVAGLRNEFRYQAFRTADFYYWANIINATHNMEKQLDYMR